MVNFYVSFNKNMEWKMIIIIYNNNAKESIMLMQINSLVIHHHFLIRISKRPCREHQRYCERTEAEYGSWKARAQRYRCLLMIHVLFFWNNHSFHFDSRAIINTTKYSITSIINQEIVITVLCVIANNRSGIEAYHRSYCVH